MILYYFSLFVVVGNIGSGPLNSSQFKSSIYWINWPKEMKKSLLKSPIGNNAKASSQFSLSPMELDQRRDVLIINLVHQLTTQSWWCTSNKRLIHHNWRSYTYAKSEHIPTLSEKNNLIWIREKMFNFKSLSN